MGRAIASGDQLANVMEMMRAFAPDQVTTEAETAINGIQSMRSMLAGSIFQHWKFAKISHYLSPNSTNDGSGFQLANSKETLLLLVA
jgi:hypothetical protein